MQDFTAAFREALALLGGADPELIGTVALSLQVSLAATLCACAFGLPAGALLAVTRFPGRRIAVAALDATLGLPSVVVGLMVYLLLSRAGPLGHLGLLFTPAAIIVAQTLLITPMVAALARQHVEQAWEDYRELFASLRLPALRSVALLLRDCRHGLLTTALAAFGRSIAEVGAAITVGGNIAGSTRTMTTTIALETSKGDLPRALGLGLVLMAMVLTVSLAAQALRRQASRDQAPT